LVLAVLLAVFGFAGPALAGFLDYFDLTGQNVTKVKFTNFEIVLRQNDSGTIELPNGKKYNVVTPGNIQVNDIAIQILNAKTIDWETPSGDVTKWSYVQNGPEFTAYALQRVASIADTNNNEYNIEFGVATEDPFGILDLSNSEIARLYFDEAPASVFTSSGTLQAGVNSATGGVFFASFGYGVAADSGRGGATGTATIEAKELLLPPPSLLVHVIGGLNVKNLPSWLTFLPIPNVANGAFTSSSLETSVTSNTAYPASSPWPLKSEDPWRFRVTPEPSTFMALLGMGAVAGVGGLIRRRRK